MAAHEHGRRRSAPLVTENAHIQTSLGRHFVRHPLGIPYRFFKQKISRVGEDVEKSGPSHAAVEWGSRGAEVGWGFSKLNCTYQRYESSDSQRIKCRGSD